MNQLWQMLTQVRQFEFTAQSQAGSRMNWHQNAQGRVWTHHQNNLIDFQEQFLFENGRTAQDKKRWRRMDNAIELQRHRNDDFEPIFTFLWQPEQQTWQMAQRYWCAPDEYRAELNRLPAAIELTIWIRSEKKNECLRYRYTVVDSM